MAQTAKLLNTSHTKIIFLGTGTPNPDPKHLDASFVILVGEKPYLVNFATGLVRQAARLTQRFGIKISLKFLAFLTANLYVF